MNAEQYNPNTMINYFDILNLPMQCDLCPQHIDHAYFKLQRENHPDMRNGEFTDVDMNIVKQINDAYAILKNDMLRAEHIFRIHNMINERDMPDNIFDMLANPWHWYDVKIKEMQDAFAINDLQSAYKAWLACKYLQRRIHTLTDG
jgi:hypothetical protein